MKGYKTAIADCVDQTSLCYRYSHSPEDKLKNKIGEEKFSSWKDVWNPDNIRAIISKAVNDEIATQDSHLYSDEVVQCLIDASKADDFQEAASNCQYNMHAVGVNDDNGNQEL